MNPKTASLVLFACVLGLCLVVSLPLHAQVTGATISGTITDTSGGVIAGAEISVRNTATGIIRNTTADSAGFYTVPNLNPGPYEVQVTEAAPQIELTSSTLSGQIESQTVLELPLNGRDWASLASLSPGVNALETQMPFESGAVRGNRGFGAQLTISGGRPTQNNYRLDGLSINDYGNGGPGSVIGVSLGVDAIQEFSVLTGNYSAEYGRTSGGVVNAISKSGTNAFHGDVYEFLRNDKLDANSFLLNLSGQPKPPYRRNQFGAAVGGPVRKDRTFFFFDYEGIRQSQVLPSPATVPSESARSGLLNFPNGPSSFPSGCAPVSPSPTEQNCQVTVDPAIVKYLALYPHANGPAVNANAGILFPSGARVVTENV